MLRNRITQIIRNNSTSAGNNTLKKLTTKQEIVNFISTPKIHIHENLVKTLTPIDISDEELIKLLKLSSLQIPEDLSIYKKPLLSQVGFLSKIHDLNPQIYEFNYNQTKDKGLKLQDILNNIKDQKQVPSKGEFESRAELLKLSTYTKNNHYIVKEGLLKK